MNLEQLSEKKVGLLLLFLIVLSKLCGFFCFLGLMDKKRTLFDVVADGDDSTLEQLLLDGKEERNVATLAVMKISSDARNIELNK